MDRIRISCAGLAKIELEGQLLLELKTRNPRYVPFGGALELHDSARPFLLSLGAELERERDLRLTLPQNNVEIFDWWFNLRKDREASPYRELQEELVDEMRVLKSLPESKVQIEYLFTKKEEGATDKPSSQRIPTRKYFEVHRASFTPDYERRILNALGTEGSRLGLASYEEVRNGKTGSGIKVADNCLALLD